METEAKLLIKAQTMSSFPFCDAMKMLDYKTQGPQIQLEPWFEPGAACAGLRTALESPSAFELHVFHVHLL